MRLLYSAFDPVPWPKGSGTRIEATVRALAAAGAEVRLHTPLATSPLAGFGPRLEVVDHRPVHIPEGNFLDRVLKFRSSVEEALADEAFDAAIFRSPWEGAPIARGVRCCAYEVHGFPSIELVSHYPALRAQRVLLDKLIGEENACLHRAKLLLTPSAMGRHFLMRRGVPPDRIMIVANSVSAEDALEVTPLPTEREPFRLGYMGTLAPWQGLGTLLEALALLNTRLPCRLVMAGTRKGSWIRQLQRQARRRGLEQALELHGPLGKVELGVVLQSCHALVAPLPDDPRNGMQGCCPIKILEYMLTSRPIISTRIAAVEEILSDGETAILVQPGSPAALAAGILRLAHEPDGGMAVAARARVTVLRDFSREQFDRQLATVLDRLS